FCLTYSRKVPIFISPVSEKHTQLSVPPSSEYQPSFSQHEPNHQASTGELIKRDTQRLNKNTTPDNPRKDSRKPSLSPAQSPASNKPTTPHRAVKPMRT